MGANTIDVSEDVYERLKPRRRDDESFSDLSTRLLDETAGDWRERFETLDSDEAEELEQAAETSRSRTSEEPTAYRQEGISDLSSENAAEATYD